MYFPSLYPDEHVYSGLIRSRYLSGQMFVNDKRFFELNELPYHWIRSQTPLCSHLKEVINKVSDDPSVRFKLRLFHTPFAPWLLSLPQEIEAKDLIDSGMRNNLEENPFATDRRWKFCPTCAENEVKNYGVSYWHSSHQSLGARVCPVHQTPLYSHDEIRYLDFTLPHHNIEKSEPLLIDSKWQQEWQPFIYSLTTHIQKNINWPASLSSFIKEHLGLNE